ncbi:MAG: LysR family transcriptional regulator [Rhizobiaceae bacterium]
MNRLPPLNWLRSFEAAARHSSFAAAAAELHLTAAAISYQVRSLEGEIGFELFERLPRGVRLTDMGRAYLPSLRKAFDDIAISTAGLFGGAREEMLTIRASLSYGALILSEILPLFRATYPHIHVRLFATVWSDREENDDADLEIRYGDGKWPGWAADRLDAADGIVVCKSGTGALQAADYLSEQAGRGVIQIMGCENHWVRLMEQEGIADAEKRLKTIAIVDNSCTALELASRGLGPALVSANFARRYLEDGRLIRPIQASIPSSSGHFLLLPHATNRLRPEALLFREWLLKRSEPIACNNTPL